MIRIYNINRLPIIAILIKRQRLLADTRNILINKEEITENNRLLIALDAPTIWTLSFQQFKNI